MRKESALKLLVILFLTILVAVFAKIFWLLPVQILFEDLYTKWFTYQGGQLSFWLLLSWLHIGAFKVVMSEIYHNKLEMARIYHGNTLLGVLVAPLLNYNLKWSDLATNTKK